MTFRVRWAPCHRRMVRDQVADGGDGLQIWRVAASILNKQSRTANKKWSSSLGLTTHRTKKKKIAMKCHKAPQTWMDYLDKQPKLSKMDMRFCT
jgi:hypothetical protein